MAALAAAGLTTSLAVALAIDPAAAAAAPAPGAGGRKALVGGLLIDGFGGPPLQNSVILIEGGKITAVGQVGQLAVPADAEVISTEGQTVLPGLFDMHVHLFIVGHSDYGHWDEAYPPRYVSEIMPAAARQLLHAGVTSARDLGAPLDDILAIKKKIAAGEIEGPELFVAGPFLQHEPYPGSESYRWGIHGEADARAKVRQLHKAGVDVIKLIDQDQMTAAEVHAVVDEAHQNGLKVVAHAHREEEIRRGLEAGVDCFEHTGLGTSPEYPPDIVAEIRRRANTLFWTPTITPLLLYEYTRDHPERIDDPRWHEGLAADTIADVKASLAKPPELDYYKFVPQRRPTVARKFAQLRESGVVLLIGTDSGVPLTFHSDSTWRELAYWVELGVPPMDAIRAATYWPALSLGVLERKGTVSPGKDADIIAVRGDLLSHIDLLQDVDLVIQAGRKVQ